MLAVSDDEESEERRTSGSEEKPFKHVQLALTGVKEKVNSMSVYQAKMLIVLSCRVIFSGWPLL